MLWRIETTNREGIFDSIGESIKKDIYDSGIKAVKEVRFIQVYYINNIIDASFIDKIARLLLTDPITQEYSYSPFANDNYSQATNKDKLVTLKENTDSKTLEIEVAFHSGVMDPWEESIKKGLSDLGIKEVEFIKTSKKYIIKGEITKEELDLICQKILLNPVIQHIVKEKSDILSKAQDYKFKLVTVDISKVSDGDLINLSKNMQLYLNLREMQEIKNYFNKLGRNPTDVEIESLAQTWSEHCKHKTLRGLIEYSEEDRRQKTEDRRQRTEDSVNSLRSHGASRRQKTETRMIDNLLKETVMKVTKELNKDWCVSVFVDNSGVIKFDDEYNICFKVETHNHPSALEPYGGANTGIGGVIRDPLGTGLGAKPIFNTDVFCFAPPDFPQNKLPPGVLHPKRIMKGVVAGVRDYGNKMGIPTINGAVIFDKDYLGNPLVYCGNAGIMPKDKSFKKVLAGDLIVLVGGRTGRDGIHGATFSSAELTQESERISSGAVQIGNPITEKKMEEAILKARDENLYNAITDCGGGGLSSAVGELGQDGGVQVNLEKVPLKYKGLSYTEIWISEAQERMILAVPRENLVRLRQIFQEEEVELTCIGEFTDDRTLTLFYEGDRVAELDMEFLHNGLPKIKRKAIWEKRTYPEPEFDSPQDLTPSLLKILSSWNVTSKEWIIRQYDHEVQGMSVLKPLVGIKNDGPSDASIVRPILSSQKGVGVSCGINSKYGKIDTYWMAASVIDEAVRQLIAVGCDIEKIALLDNFCWGNTDKPKQLGSLVRAAFACYDIAKELETPFISGKDSLNNEYNIGKESVSIPPTLLISAIGILDDVSCVVSMDLKQADNLIYILGTTFSELGGSEYYNIRGFLGNEVPRLNPKIAKLIYENLNQAIRRKLVYSVHDCSEGGIGVTCCEMAFAGGLGMEIFLREVPVQVTGNQKPVTRDDVILFSESNSRFIVEVDKKNQEEFEKLMQDNQFGLIGCVSEKPEFKVYGLDGEVVVSVDIDKLKEAWQRPLRW